jgi:hypothetical protein
MMGSGHRMLLLCWITLFLLIFASTVHAVDDVLSLISSQVVVKKSSTNLHRSSLAEEKGALPYSKEVSHLPDAKHEHHHRRLRAKAKGKEMGKSGKGNIAKGKGKEMDAKGKVKDGMKKINTSSGMMSGNGKVSKMTTSTPIIAPVISPAMSSPASTPVIGPTIVAPVVGVPINSSPTPVQTVRVTDYYVAFVAPDATREPTPDEYDEMSRRITAYFNDTFTGIYATDPNTEFLDVVSSNDFSLYGTAAGIPEARFNIYMNFDFSDFTFTEASVVPTSAEIFQIMRDAITPDFIIDVVRTYTGTPFDSTNEVFFSASEFNGPP